MPLSISKFIRSRLNKTRLHREWKEGRKSIGTQRKGAPPPACISFDFAMPSIFIPVGEGRDRATIEHNVDRAREKRVGWLLSFLPSNLDRGEKGKGKKLLRFPASRRLIAWNVANHVRTKETRSKRPRSTRGPFLTKNWNASQHIPRGCGSRPGT